MVICVMLYFIVDLSVTIYHVRVAALRCEVAMSDRLYRRIVYSKRATLCFAV
jgi:hypothetical protein